MEEIYWYSSVIFFVSSLSSAIFNFVLFDMGTIRAL